MRRPCGTSATPQAANFLAEIAAILRELVLGQEFRTADQFAVHARPVSALAGAILHGLHLHVVPVGPEGGENAAVMRHVAVPVGRALPDAHGGEMRRLQRSHMPLIDAVIGNAVQPDPAVRPGLHPGPLDAMVEVFCFARRKVIDITGRTAAAARIHPRAGIAVRHPFLGIDRFPVLVFVARSFGDVGVLGDHALPGARIAVLKGRPLGVRSVCQQDEAIVHLDLHIPVDAHAVAHFAARPMRAADKTGGRTIGVPNRMHAFPPAAGASVCAVGRSQRRA
jgi:hypothetical protein